MTTKLGNFITNINYYERDGKYIWSGFVLLLNERREAKFAFAIRSLFVISLLRAQN